MEIYLAAVPSQFYIMYIDTYVHSQVTALHTCMHSIGTCELANNYVDRAVATDQANQAMA